MTLFLMLFVLGLILFGIGLIIGLKLNKETFYDGKLVIKDSDEGKRTFSLEMDMDPYELQDLDIIVFKVIDESYDE